MGVSFIKVSFPTRTIAPAGSERIKTKSLFLCTSKGILLDIIKTARLDIPCEYKPSRDSSWS